MYDLSQNFHFSSFSLHFINNVLTLAHPTLLPLPIAHINLSLNCQADSKPYWKTTISFGRRRILTSEVHIETRKRKQVTKTDLSFCGVPVLHCHLNTLISHLHHSMPFHLSTFSRWFYIYLRLLRPKQYGQICPITAEQPCPVQVQASSPSLNTAADSFQGI